MIGFLLAFVSSFFLMRWMRRHLPVEVSLLAWLVYLSYGLYGCGALQAIGLAAEDIIPAVLTGGASLPFTLGGQAIGAGLGGAFGGGKGALTGASFGGAAGGLGYGGYNALNAAPTSAGAGATDVPGGVGGSPSFQQGLSGTPAPGGSAPNFIQNVGSAESSGFIPGGSQSGPAGSLGIQQNPLRFSDPSAFAPELSGLGSGTGAGVGAASGFTPSSGGTPPGPAGPLGDPNQGSMFNKDNLQKAMLALQALQAGRGFLPSTQPQTKDPYADIAGIEQQQQADKQRAILASLPRMQADFGAAGLSGGSDDLLAQMLQNQFGPQQDALSMVQQYLQQQRG